MGRIITLFKFLMSLTFFILLIMKIFYQKTIIDNITIILAILMFAPWIIQYIKTLEVSGLGKVEFFDKEKKKEIEQKVGAVTSSSTNSKDPTTYNFYNLRYEDPKLALAALRIEIEDKLRSIAAKEGIETKNAGLNQITDLLNSNQLLTHTEIEIIKDLTTVLNKAVNSQLKNYKNESFQWIIDVGIKLIDSLDEKCQK